MRILEDVDHQPPPAPDAPPWQGENVTIRFTFVSAILLVLTISGFASAAPDLSTPKTAALAFAKAVDAADPEATKAVVIADAQNQEMAALVAELAGNRNK